MLMLEEAEGCSLRILNHKKTTCFLLILGDNNTDDGSHQHTLTPSHINFWSRTLRELVVRLPQSDFHLLNFGLCPAEFYPVTPPGAVKI